VAKKENLNTTFDTSGLYHEHNTITNGISTVISEGCHNLEHHSRVISYDPKGVIYTHC